MFTALDSIFGSSFLLAITTLSFALKGFILIQLVLRGLQNPTTKRPFLFLLLVLIASMVADSAWIFYLIRSSWLPDMDYRPYLFWVRISWGFSVLQYQALSLFMESLVSQSPTIPLRQKLYIFVSSLFISFAIFLAFFDINCLHSANRPP